MLKHLGVLDGYASNISHCFNLKESKLFNLKSHCHIVMQDLLPIALQSTKDNDFVEVICTLSSIFKELCAKELTIGMLDEVEANVVVMLC